MGGIRNVQHSIPIRRRSTPIRFRSTRRCATSIRASGARTPTCGYCRATTTSCAPSTTGRPIRRRKGNLMTELPNRAGATLGTTDPPRHDRLRGLVAAGLHEAQSRSARPIRCAPSRRSAARHWRSQKQFDFVEDFSSKFTVRVLFAALGLPIGDEQTVRDKAVLMVQSDPNTRAKGPEHIAAYDWMQDYAGRVIAQRRANPQNDLISQFSTGRDRRRQARRARGAADHDDADHGRHRVARRLHVDVRLQPRRFRRCPRARCVANPTLLADAIEESLRFNTSAQRFRRCLMKDTRTARANHEGRRFRLPRLRLRQSRRAASSRIPTSTISRASRADIWASAAACTPASARRSRAWRSESRSRSSTRSCRTTRACRSNCRGCRRHVPQPDAAGTGAVEKRGRLCRLVLRAAAFQPLHGRGKEWLSGRTRNATLGQ